MNSAFVLYDTHMEQARGYCSARKECLSAVELSQAVSQEGDGQTGVWWISKYDAVRA